MSRMVTRKEQPQPATDGEAGLVRTAKAIPAMVRPVELLEPPPIPGSNPCSGRCGHCTIHPCQLHAPI